MLLKKSLISTAVVAAMLAGCAPNQQDEGTDQVAMSIRAVDGYVMRGTVYADLNENGKMDFFESPDKASTDTSGFAGYNDINAEDYCASSDETKAARCLKVTSGVGEVVFRVAGGYNKSTGVEFVGTLSARVPVGGTASPLTISPITSVMVNMDSAAIDAFATANGLTVAELKSDYLDVADTSISDANRLKLLATGMHLHKTADVLFATINGDTTSVLTSDFHGSFGTASGLIPDATVYAYDAIAANLGAADVSTALNNATTAGLMITDLVSTMNTKVTETNVETGGIIPTANVSGVQANIEAKVTALAGVIDTVFTSALTADDTGTTTVNEMEKDMLSRERAVDVVTALLRTREATDPAVVDAIAAASDATYLGYLKDDKFSMTSLVNSFETGQWGVSGAEIANFVNRTTLDLSSALSVSDGTDTIGMSFTEGTEAGSGTFTLDPGTMDLGGELALTDATGNPIALEGTYEQVDPYTSVMTVEVAPGITKDYVVTTNDDGTGYLIDIGGELVPFTPTP